MLFEHKNLVRLSLQSLGFGLESWVEGKMSRAECKMSRVHKKEKMKTSRFHRLDMDKFQTFLYTVARYLRLWVKLCK